MTEMSRKGKQTLEPLPRHRLTADPDEGDARGAKAPRARRASAARRARRPTPPRRRGRSTRAGRAPGGASDRLMGRAALHPDKERGSPHRPPRRRPRNRAARRDPPRSRRRPDRRAAARSTVRGPITGRSTLRLWPTFAALSRNPDRAERGSPAPPAKLGHTFEHARRCPPAPSIATMRSPKATSAWPTSKGERHRDRQSRAPPPRCGLVGGAPCLPEAPFGRERARGDLGHAQDRKALSLEPAHHAAQHAVIAATDIAQEIEQIGPADERRCAWSAASDGSSRRSARRRSSARAAAARIACRAAQARANVAPRRSRPGSAIPSIAMTINGAARRPHRLGDRERKGATGAECRATLGEPRAARV